MEGSQNSKTVLEMKPWSFSNLSLSDHQSDSGMLNRPRPSEELQVRGWGVCDKHQKTKARKRMQNRKNNINKRISCSGSHVIFFYLFNIGENTCFRVQCSGTLFAHCSVCSVAPTKPTIQLNIQAYIPQNCVCGKSEIPIS